LGENNGGVSDGRALKKAPTSQKSLFSWSVVRVQGRCVEARILAGRRGSYRGSNLVDFWGTFQGYLPNSAADRTRSLGAGPGYASGIGAHGIQFV